ncbi:hypothetical protein N7488_005936 [Penicillium malachiteum]|nr:hypothetical protein N7488_005936 [Penicillium malachiteum]
MYWLAPFHFRYRSGAGKKEIRVHSSPIAGLSQPLNTLINKKMLEAKTGRVEWPDMDEDTFIRLYEFAYLRNYTPPTPTLFPDVEFRLHPNKPTHKRPAFGPSQAEPQAKRQVMDPSQTNPPPAGSSSDEPVPTSQPKAFKTELPSRNLSIQAKDLEGIFVRNLVAPNIDTGSLRRTYQPYQNISPLFDFRPVFFGQVRL